MKILNSLQIAKYHWKRLGDIPINDEEEIDQDFYVFDLCFEKGTSRTEIWHWFETTFNVNIAKDLMYNKNNK